MLSRSFRRIFETNCGSFAPRPRSVGHDSRYSVAPIVFQGTTLFVSLSNLASRVRRGAGGHHVRKKPRRGWLAIVRARGEGYVQSGDQNGSEYPLGRRSRSSQRGDHGSLRSPCDRSRFRQEVCHP